MSSPFLIILRWNFEFCGRTQLRNGEVPMSLDDDVWIPKSSKKKRGENPGKKIKLSNLQLGNPSWNRQKKNVFFSNQKMAAVCFSLSRPPKWWQVHKLGHFLVNWDGFPLPRLANLGIERFYSRKKTMNQQTYENKALEVLGWFYLVWKSLITLQPKILPWKSLSLTQDLSTKVGGFRENWTRWAKKQSPIFLILSHQNGFAMLQKIQRAQQNDPKMFSGTCGNLQWQLTNANKNKNNTLSLLLMEKILHHLRCLK